MTSKRRGLSMLEVSISGIVLVVLMAGLLSIFSAINGEQSFASNMPQAQYSAEQMALTIAKAIRGATLSTTGTNYILNSAVDGGSSTTAASSTTLAVYSGTASSPTRTTYSNSSGSVTTSTGGTTSTMYSNASVSFAYYTSSTYHTTSLGTSSTSLSAASAPSLVAVVVTSTCTVSGRTATYSTLVRLRNGPLRSSPND